MWDAVWLHWYYEVPRLSHRLISIMYDPQKCSRNHQQPKKLQCSRTSADTVMIISGFTKIWNPIFERLTMFLVLSEQQTHLRRRHIGSFFSNKTNQKSAIVTFGLHMNDRVIYCRAIQRTNTLRPRQNGWHFADDTFKCVSLNENIWIALIFYFYFSLFLTVQLTIPQHW